MEGDAVLGGACSCCTASAFGLESGILPSAVCLHRNHSSFWLVHPLSKQAKGASQKKLHRKLAVLKNSCIFASPFEKGAVFSEFYFEIPPFATTLIGAARRE